MNRLVFLRWVENVKTRKTRLMTFKERWGEKRKEKKKRSDTVTGLKSGNRFIFVGARPRLIWTEKGETARRDASRR